MLKHLAEWLSMISAALLVSSYFNVRLDGIIWGFIDPKKACVITKEMVRLK